MDQVVFSPPGSALDWFRVWRLYRRSFPPSERKPFSIIRSMYRRGKTDLWCILRNGRFAGFASTVNSGELILLDYLATLPQYRGQGIGSAALHLLKQRYPGKGVFVEIEETRDPGKDQALRIRRRQFYEAAGMEDLNVTAMVFGVKMELLGWGCRMDFDAYKAFYRDHYNPWAAEHILPVS